jgi:8-oxo-dGTP diphosphatase
VDVTDDVVRAAGGLVRRRGQGGDVDIVLVHRLAYDDWTFPKGKLHDGETEEDAALREVEEETGLRCRLDRDLGLSSYRDARGRPKTVRYWTMTAIDGILAPAHEIDDARWLPLDVASATLSYPRDREVIARFKATHRS